MDETLEKLLAVLMSSSAKTGGKQGAVPTERDLAAMLGVNRSTVRERLSVLEILGLIKRTRGRGTHLDVPDAAFLQLYFDTAMKMQYVQIEQLEQAREAIDRAAVREAARAATAAEIARLEGHLKQMLESDSVAKGAAADFAFHRELVNCSKNPVLILIMDGLSPIVQHFLEDKREMMPQIEPRISSVNTVHAPIVTALHNHDVVAAQEAMDRHYYILDEALNEGRS
jgi:GntR family transcriptional regulator, transcriptional repressor for pyruvate dehydrogenase complex